MCIYQLCQRLQGCVYDCISDYIFADLFFLQESASIEMVAEENEQLQPYILVVGDVENPTQTFLITDHKVVTEVPLDDIPLTLMAAYFAYNMLPKGLYQLFHV